MAGETTARSGIDPQVLPLAQGPVLNGAVWTTELATTQLELNDVIQMGYLPAGVTLIGFVAFTDDLDSGTALVWKITVGVTDVKTGVTIGQITPAATINVPAGNIATMARILTTAELLGA